MPSPRKARRMRKKADLWHLAFEWFSNRYVLTAAVGLVWVTFISEIDLVYLAKVNWS